jgi:hypothetical protein
MERNAVVDMKLEVVVEPVSDVDRAKGFYEEIGHADPDWPDWYAQYMVDEQVRHTS